MVVRANSLRPFQRLHNGVLIYLQLDEWPADLPLPEGTTLVETGEGPFSPYWDLVLEPDRTIEVVVGWFIIPPSLDEAIVWYRREMGKRGWAELTDRSSRLPQSAGLRFQHSETGIRTVVDLLTRPHTKQTDLMIRRVVVHPWPPAEEQASERGLTPNRPHADESAPVHSLAEVEEALPREEEVQVAV